MFWNRSSYNFLESHPAINWCYYWVLGPNIHKIQVSVDRELFHQGHPEDIFPMVLTSATQEHFGCRTDKDVTIESPYKLLKKDDIIQDIKTRAAVSDFRPVKQIVLVRLIHCHTDRSDNTPKTLWWYTDSQVTKMWEQSSNQFNFISHLSLILMKYVVTTTFTLCCHAHSTSVHYSDVGPIQTDLFFGDACVVVCLFLCS